MSVCRLGFLTIYLSTPLTRGFTTGASMHVFTSQVKHVFGIETTETFSGPLKLVYVSTYFYPSECMVVHHLKKTFSVTNRKNTLSAMIKFFFSRGSNHHTISVVDMNTYFSDVHRHLWERWHHHLGCSYYICCVHSHSIRDQGVYQSDCQEENQNAVPDGAGVGS